MQKPVEAASEAYGLYKRGIFEALRYLGLSPDESRDICQDVFLRYYEWLAEGGAVDNPRAWLMTSAKNKAFDFFKSADQKKTVREDFWLDASTDCNEKSVIGDLEQTPRTSPNETMFGSNVGRLDASIYIQDCVERKLREFAVLYPTQAQAISEQFDGHTTSEIANLIGRTEAATRTFLCEAKKKLKPYLDDCKELLNPE